MKKFCFLFAALAGLMLVLSLPHSAVAKKEKKNILFIVADDLGTDALRLYTDKLNFLTPRQRAQVPPTPTIDSLAANGVTFNNAWANPACSPTRGTLITGRYGFRTGITRVIGPSPGETPPVELDVDDPELLPKVLKEKGYRTALIGKWHLTSENDPNESGFDHWAGFLRGGLGSYYSWPQIFNGGDEQTQTTFATTENVDQAIEFITNVPTDTPWFVSLNFAAPHWPYQLPPEELVNDGTPAGISVYDKVIDELGSYTQPPPPPPRLTLFQLRAIFNAMIYAMDSEIGRLLDNVDLDNTCIIFIGDNGTQGLGGPRPNNVVVPPFDRSKAKGTLYEGGIRVPMVVSDPEIKKPGGFTNALVNTVDIYAMILKIAGCPSPNRFDGKHFKAVLESSNNDDDDVSVRNFIYADIERGGFLNQAIRNDRYKIIFNSGEPEFYDLLEDPFEENDLLLGDRTNKEKSNYKWLLNKLENLLAS